MEMIGHDHESMHEIFLLVAIIQNRLLKQLRVRCNLKQPPPLRRDSRYQIGSNFLWCKRHFGKNIRKTRG